MAAGSLHMASVISALFLSLVMRVPRSAGSAAMNVWSFMIRLQTVVSRVPCD
jgi:hypothetical protein